MKRRFIYCIVLLTGLVCAACGKKDEVLRTDRTRALVRELLTKLDSSDVYAARLVNTSVPTISMSTTRGKMFGNTPSRVNLTIGALNFEGGQTVTSPPEVSKLVYGIYDPDNRLRGSLIWHEPWGAGEFPVVGAEKYSIGRYREVYKNN